MKKLFTIIAFVTSLTIFAQAPQGFNYQATVRNSVGNLILNQIVLVKFNILQNSSTGTVVYTETQTANTDDLGHISLVVGQGNATTGSFSNINWGNGTYYLGIELNTGSGYVPMGTKQLFSVPYALYAQSSGNGSTIPSGTNIGDILTWNGTSWVLLPIGANGQILNVCNGVPTWGPCILPSSNGTAVITSFNSCTTASAGTLTAGVAVSGVTQTINLTVGTIGTYNISATANGVTFSATGTFTTTGSQNLILTCSGTPLAVGTNTFTLNTTPNCSFTRNTVSSSNGSSNGTAVITSFNSCTTASAGTLAAGVAVSGVTQTINLTVGTIGTYNISATANGVTFSKTGTFTTTGAQNLILAASGTPTASGTNTFTLNTTPNCSFNRSTVNPFTVNAGADQCSVDGVYSLISACGSPSGYQRVSLTGSAIPSGATSNWSVISGNSPLYCMAGGGASSWGQTVANDNTIDFIGKPGKNYTLQYSVTLNGVTVSDTVLVCFNPCRNYSITRIGGTNQHTFAYRICNSTSEANLQTLPLDGSIVVCLHPGSFRTDYPASFSVVSTTNCN